MRGYLGITVHYVESGKSKNVLLGGPRFKGKLGIFSWAVIKLVLFQTANIDLFSGTPIDLQITLLLVYKSTCSDFVITEIWNHSVTLSYTTKHLSYIFLIEGLKRDKSVVNLKTGNCVNFQLLFKNLNL